MEPRWWSRSLVAGCLVLLLGCWRPEEAAAAVSVGRSPCFQALPSGAVPAGRGGGAEPSLGGKLLIPFSSGAAEGGLLAGRAGVGGVAAGPVCDRSRRGRAALQRLPSPPSGVAARWFLPGRAPLPASARLPAVLACARWGKPGRALCVLDPLCLRDKGGGNFLSQRRAV